MRRATPRLSAYTAIALFGMLGAVAVQRPEPALLALPFAFLVLVGMAGTGPLGVATETSVDATRVNVGETFDVTIRLTAGAAHPWAEVELRPPPGLAVERWRVGGDGPDDRAETVGAVATLALREGEPVDLVAVVRAERWGAYRPVAARLVVTDRFRLLRRETSVTNAAVVRVHPPVSRLRRLADPRWLQGVAGAHRSRERRDGIEFADTRPWAPGDGLRAVNWRASARRGSWFVSDRHPDSSADVVLFVDALVDVGHDLDSTLGMTVEATIALAEGHLGDHDRVGVIGFGGFLDWILPGLGTAQLHRIVDSVLDTVVVGSLADRSLTVVPIRALPPRAMVVALTPLADPRSYGVLARLRGRGSDLLVVEVSPAPFVESGPSPADGLAHRAWLLEREIVRQRLRRIGATVVSWRHGDPFAAVLAEAASWRARPVAR
jgi:uncharacterized protein (DUF58 family)